MTKKSKRVLYEPPRARDLSAFGVVGDGPQGECQVGPTPYYACTLGSGFVGECVAGTVPDTSACVTGGFHTFPACDRGNNAVTICFSGAGQNF